MVRTEIDSPTVFPRPPLTAFAAGSVRVASNSHTIRLLCIFAVCISSELLFMKRLNSASGHSARPGMSGFYLGMIVSELALAYGVLQGIRAYGVGIRELTRGRWASPRDVAIDVGIATGLLICWIALVSGASVVLDALHLNTASSSVNQILPVGAVEYVLWVCVSHAAGFCEELAFRGYFQRQFQAVSGSLPIAVACRQSCLASFICMRVF